MRKFKPKYRWGDRAKIHDSVKKLSERYKYVSRETLRNEVVEVRRDAPNFTFIGGSLRLFRLKQINDALAPNIFESFSPGEVIASAKPGKCYGREPGTTIPGNNL